MRRKPSAAHFLKSNEPLTEQRAMLDNLFNAVDAVLTTAMGVGSLPRLVVDLKTLNSAMGAIEESCQPKRGGK